MTSKTANWTGWTREKKTPPIASGRIGTTGALVAIAILVTMSAALSLALPWAFSAVLAVYFGQNIFYTYLGKRILLVDVFMIALGFVLRVIAGAAAIDIAPAPGCFRARFSQPVSWFL
jgi:decaprenyl-phosphate phosphoribosyltransferase